MSHTTRVKAVKVLDLNALEAAVQNFARERKVNISFERNAPVRLWSTTPKVDAVVKVPGTRFDLGFERQEDGSYTPVFDAHGGYLAAVLGGGRELAKTPEEHMLSQIGGIMQAYTREVLMRTAHAQGALVSEHIAADGTVVLQIA